MTSQLQGCNKAGLYGPLSQYVFFPKGSVAATVNPIWYW